MIAEPRRDDLIAMYQNLISEAVRAASRINDDSIRSDSGLPTFATNIETQMKTIREPFRLGVVGMFKSGKSSVLNTFLRKDVLKEGRTETTSVLTEMIFAESQELERGEVLFKNGSVINFSSIDEALEYTDIRSDHFKGDNERRRVEQQKIDRVRVYVYSGLLQNVVLVDTPGFGGSEIGDVMAFEALNTVDAALMVFSADRTGAEDELKIADELNLKGREVVAMLNQCDDSKGNFRREDDIRECELFIRENFRTLVKGNNGEAVIFRYSALEVKKVLHKEKHTTEDLELLKKWGYLPNGEKDCEKGAALFLRDRYFSGDTASHRQKMTAAKTALLSEINRLLRSSASEQHRAEERHKELECLISRTNKEIEERVLSKIPIIETELEEEVRTLVREYSRKLADVLDIMLEEMKDFSFFDAFKSQEKIQKEFGQRFRQNFDLSNDQILVKRIIRKSETIFRLHWKQIGREISDLKITIEGMSIEGMLTNIASALNEVAVHIASTTAAVVALLFVPGGVLLDLLWTTVSALLGFDSAGKVRRQIAQAQRQIRNRVHQEADKILEGSLDELIKNNRKLADRLTDILKKGAQPAEEESGRLVGILEVLKHVQMTFEKRLKTTQEYDFVSSKSEAA
ncbi:MAG: dynamin family protein [Chlorobium sp.]